MIRIYENQYVDFAEKYFGGNLNADGQCCRVKAMLHDP